MSINRYRRAPKIKNGKSYGTFTPSYFIYQAATTGRLECQNYTTKEGERLDILAGKYLGDGKLWWAIAAASGIGWNLQVPPGTFLRIPVNAAQLNQIIG
tara:strand:- start:191 stop:487 length:297 start_codon:yes stop_codon:yes gene_type:complete